ncbi:MAG: copper resistance system multicopper oxidase [Alphaproteobacteria bacterium]|nr:copper resistance system multicopper oxidase [Alphaproteobacteria bacterium]
MSRILSRRGALRFAAAAGMAGAFWIYPGRRSFASATRELDLAVERTRITIDGVQSAAIAIGGSVPAPTMRWREGDEVVIRVTNRLAEDTSIHWHGLLLAGVMDGAPGFNGFVGIKPGETYTYRFKLRQSGTYWYHSHSSAQEQAGMYGAIVIEPAVSDPVRVDHDHTVLLSDHSAMDPTTIYRKLKAGEGYFNRGQRSVADFFRDAQRDGFTAALRDRRDWGDMRMDPTDLADVTGYSFLINGKGPQDNWTAEFQPGQRLRLRIINGSAMTIFDVAIPGLKMTVISADGQNVVPVPVDEFRIGVGETYDVVVAPREAKAFTLMVEPIDRSGYARATIAPRAGMEGPIPPLRPRALLTMADMGPGHMASMGMADTTSGAGHGAMGHGAPAPTAANPHAGHAMPAPATPPANTAADPHAGHAMPSAAALSDPARPLGWASAGTPAGMRALKYEDLKSLTRRPRAPEPVMEIDLRLTGVMFRYTWSLNGRRFGDDEPIRVRYGDRVRIRFINETMMAHPMHLHGMFMELENGETERRPFKHVVLVRPGKSASVVLTADEVGDWPLHCHLLYHMHAGMMTRFIVEPEKRRAAVQ